MVKCKDCGYVGAREFQTRILLEVDEGFREQAERGHVMSNKTLYFGKPICAAMVFNLGSEVAGDGRDDTLAILHMNRNCDVFTSWQQGYSPKEHLDMNLLKEQQAAEQSRREQEQEWQRQCDADDRKWREEQERVAETRHRENLKLVADSAKWNVKAALLAAVIGVIGTLLAVWVTLWIGAY